MSGKELESFIYEQGPLSREEVESFPKATAVTYLDVMKHKLKTLGPEEFVAQKDELFRIWQAAVDSGQVPLH